MQFSKEAEVARKICKQREVSGQQPLAQVELELLSVGLDFLQ